MTKSRVNGVSPSLSKSPFPCKYYLLGQTMGRRCQITSIFINFNKLAIPCQHHISWYLRVDQILKEFLAQNFHQNSNQPKLPFLPLTLHCASFPCCEYSDVIICISASQAIILYRCQVVLQTKAQTYYYRNLCHIICLQPTASFSEPYVFSYAPAQNCSQL